jgi:hopanoid biosynthesis associated protein HpnK
VRRLIINADDFGLTSGVNRAIVDAHDHGVVTSATLMANARASDEAVRLARSHPNLDVGCHLVLVDGRPISDPAGLSSLVRVGSGRFHAGLPRLGISAFSARLDPEQVETEASQQIRWLQSRQLEVSHVDAHKHAHILPAVLRGVLWAARACGVGAVRNPFEPAWSLTAVHANIRPVLWKRCLAARSLSILRASFREQVAKAGLLTTDGTVGIVVTGSLDVPGFRRIVESMPEGSWEFVCHPGYDDEELRASGTKLLQSRARELALLRSPQARELLVRHNVDLISYRDL